MRQRTDATCALVQAPLHGRDLLRAFEITTSECSMYIDRRWLLLLAIAGIAAAGAAAASKWRRRQHRAVRDVEHHAAVSSWESEGGNLPPIPTASALP